MSEKKQSRPENSDERINAALSEWRQGDCTVEASQFLFAYDKKFPSTNTSRNLDPTESTGYAEEQVEGLIILTQTCDIIRKIQDRPFVEIAPIVSVNGSDLLEIAKRKRPRCNS